MRNIAVIITILLLGACQKEPLPPTTSGEPVFLVKTADGSIDITAGDEHFYQFTAFTKDEENIHTFQSRFAKLSDCTEDCSEELLIEIRDFQVVNTGESVNINQALAPGDYTYRQNDTMTNPIVEGYTVFFRSAEDASLDHHWDFGDGDTSNEVNPAHTFSNQLSSSQVCLTTTDPLVGCEVTDCQLLFFTGAGVTSNCFSDLQMISQNPIQDSLFWEVTLMVSNTGIAPFNFDWGNPILNGEVITQVLSINTPAVPFCVNVTDATGCIDEICKTIDLSQNVPRLCGASFQLDSSAVEWSDPVDTLDFSEVTITYTDLDNQIYTSRHSPQPINRFFTILEVEDYLDNENGEATKRLKVAFTATLFDDVGTPLLLEDASGFIAIAYPR